MLEKPKITDPNQKSKDFLDAKVISGGANEETYEILGRFETALQKRILAFKTAMILGFYYCGLQFTPKVVQNESKFEQVLDQQLCNLNKIFTIEIFLLIQNIKHEFEYEDYIVLFFNEILQGYFDFACGQ